MSEIPNGDDALAVVLDRKAFRAAMLAYYDTIPGDISGGKKPVAAAIRAYLLESHAAPVPARPGPPAQGSLL